MSRAGRTTTQRELERLVRKWQPRLGLRDWTIKVELVRHYRHEAYAYGSVDHFAPKRTAEIKVVHPRDQQPDDHNVELGHFDPEVVVVHELLHVALWAYRGASNGSARYAAQEQAVHQLSLVLTGKA